jgi:hypothetical protein
MPTITRRAPAATAPPALLPRGAWAVGLLAAALALSTAGRGRAEPLPLPAADQARVDQAIERGVQFLKKSQGPQGSWAGARDRYFLGYAALPGLTLLECGVPANDPAVRRAAAFVRRQAPGNNATYEIALAILFLDRLGDPKDEPLIRALAVRLLAGQDGTGGWNYRCGAVGKKNQEEIVALLRKMGPPGHAPGLMGLPAVKPGAAPGLPAKKPPAFEGTPVAPKPNGLPATGPAAGAPATPTGTTTGPGQKTGETAPTGTPKDAPAVPALEGRKPPPKAGAAERPNNPGEKAPEGGVVIPKNLRVLAVFNDRAGGPLDGGRVRRSAEKLDRTDNSNSQFALLALWAAQRHDVPLERTLRLAARRYEKTQNGDGTWDYLFYYGGFRANQEVEANYFNRRPQMTCVGLLGLAIGHGLEPPAEGKVPQDPQIVNGLAALSRTIGQRQGPFRPLVPQQNLYYLWSLERVGMLYDLPTIGGKDWYGWGAEILVANQQPMGHWDKGAYIGSTKQLDTCLALLFLKRANLAKDLTARLPFDRKELEKTITLKAASPAAAPIPSGSSLNPPVPKQR